MPDHLDQLMELAESDFGDDLVEQMRTMRTQRVWARKGGQLYPAQDFHFQNARPGTYSIDYSDKIGIYISPKRVVTDDLLLLPDKNQDYILREFDRFWGCADAFEEYGFLHKRGILLWGPPGSGKTTTINLLSGEIVNNHQGIVLFAHSNAAITTMGIGMVRTLEPDTKMLVVIEDIDTVGRGNSAQDWLNLLDGNAQVPGVMYLATTNYPERLDDRFLDRPSRFDTVMLMPMPELEARIAYLRAKVPQLTDAEIDEWAAKTEGFSLAHMKELVIAVKCLGQSVDEAISRMLKLKQNPPDSGYVGHGPLRAPRPVKKDTAQEQAKAAAERVLLTPNASVESEQTG